MDTGTDHDKAAELATSAGALLLQVRAREMPDAAALKDAGDAEAHRFLLDRLTAERPDDAVLSEEGADDAARLDADRVWIVDPLDGTREYAEAGRTDWAVHVALWERRAGGLTGGAVALPATGVVLGSDTPPPYPTRTPGPLTLAVSRTRPPEFMTALAERLEAELVPMGSAGAKASAVIEGRVDAYVHTGGQYEWDSAAPVAVARAAGLHTSRIDGSPLRYNARDPLLPDLLVCRPELAESVLAITA